MGKIDHRQVLNLLSISSLSPTTYPQAVKIAISKNTANLLLTAMENRFIYLTSSVWVPAS